MRLHCTVLLAIAVAIVSTNALNGVDGEERMLNKSSGFKQLSKASSSNSAIDPDPLKTKALNELKSELTKLTRNVDATTFFRWDGIHNLDVLVEQYTRDYLSTKLAFAYVRDHYSDEEIIKAIDTHYEKLGNFQDRLFGDWMLGEKVLSVAEVQELTAGLELEKDWVQAYKDYISREISSIDESKKPRVEKKDKLSKLLEN